MNKSEKQATVTVDNPIKTQQLAPHTLSVDTVQDTTQQPAVWDTADAAAAGVNNARWGSLKSYYIVFDLMHVNVKIKSK